MAIFGRRQPHAPLIIKGGPPGPLARLVMVGQKTGQLAVEDRYWRRGLTPVFVSPLPEPPPGIPPIGQVIETGQAASQRSADRLYRRAFTPVIILRNNLPPAPPAPLGRAIVIRDRDTNRRFYRPTPAPIIKTYLAPPVVVSPPVGFILSATQQARDAAIAAAHRLPYSSISRFRIPGAAPVTARWYIKT